MRAIPRLMAIRNPGSLLALETWLADLARSAAAIGVDAVQIRDREATDREVYEQCVAARTALPPSIALLVNRRPDLALASGAHGVQLPAAGLPVADVRRAFGEKMLIGCSTHSIEEVADARAAGADFVLFGPVYATPAKLRFGPPQGLDALRSAVEVGIPVLAVGGIDPQRLFQVAEAGARGAAAIRLFEDPAALARVAGSMREAFAAKGSKAHV